MRTASRLTLAALTLAGCTAEASEDQIHAALVACEANDQARIVEGGGEGTSSLVVDFQLEGRRFRDTAACVRGQVEMRGVKPPTMFGGPSRYTPIPPGQMKNPPRLNPESLNAQAH